MIGRFIISSSIGALIVGGILLFEGFPLEKNKDLLLGGALMCGISTLLAGYFTQELPQETLRKILEKNMEYLPPESSEYLASLDLLGHIQARNHRKNR